MKELIGAVLFIIFGLISVKLMRDTDWNLTKEIGMLSCISAIFCFIMAASVIAWTVFR